MRDAPQAHFAHPAILSKDRRRVQPFRLLRRCGHPVNAIGSKQIEIAAPVLTIQQLRLIEQKLLDRSLQVVILTQTTRGQRRAHFAPPEASPRYSAQARNWLRIGASEVPLFE